MLSIVGADLVPAPSLRTLLAKESLPDTFIVTPAKVVIHVWLQQPSGFPLQKFLNVLKSLEVNIIANQVKSMVWRKRAKA